MDSIPPNIPALPTADRALSAVSELSENTFNTAGKPSETAVAAKSSPQIGTPQPERLSLDTEPDIAGR